MSKIEKSIEKALKLRDRSLPVRRSKPLPPDIPHLNDLNYGEEEKLTHLRDYLEVLIKRKWIVIVFLVTVVITVTIASFMMKPLYKATSTIQLKSGKSNILTFEDVYHQGINSETQYNILKSKNLAERVKSKLPPEYTPQSTDRGLVSSVMQSLNSLISIFGEIDKESEKEGVMKPITVGTIRGGLEIVPIKKSALVTINFVSEDPVFSAEVANTVVEEYINYMRERKLEPTQEGGERLRKEAEDMRDTLEASERELNEFIAKSQFMVTKNDEEYENLLTKKFSMLVNQLNTITSERITKEAIYNEVKKSGIDYNVVLEKPIIQSLMKEYIDLESEYSSLLTIHKPAYPKMVQLKDEIENIKKRIEIEEQNIVNTLESDYNLALKKEKLLSSAIEKIRHDVTAFQQNMILFLRLKREVETNREIYNSLLQRLKEIDISAALTENDVTILDRAQIPGRPYKPKKASNILLSLMFGLIGGVFLAFFAEYFDNTIKTDDEVEKITRLPVLGKVPFSKTKPGEFVNVNSGDNNMAFSEAFRSIGTRIQFSNASKLPTQLLITSPLENEGKTLISASIAMSLISSQEKGIIIDADLRRPDVHSLFNLDNSNGLSSFLACTSEFDGLIKKSPYAGLDVITSGPIPPNPSALLSSSRMRELIDALSASYDYIIVDSSPVLGMSDSLILSILLDNVIMVVKANKTPRDALTQTYKALTGVHANTLGTVLNGVEANNKYAYSSYYSSSYLKGNGKKKELMK